MIQILYEVENRQTLVQNAREELRQSQAQATLACGFSLIQPFSNGAWLCVLRENSLDYWWRSLTSCPLNMEVRCSGALTIVEKQHRFQIKKRYEKTGKMGRAQAEV